tara:strand:- start:1539 stop:1733 length:195 start_codon:yes stop_codon:yes gene_type:complete
LNKSDLEKVRNSGFEEVIMLGVKGDNITVVSTCEDPTQTTAILEFATNQSLLDVFPHLRGKYVH